MSSGPKVRSLATSPLPFGGSPPLQSGGQNSKMAYKGGILATSLLLSGGGSPTLEIGGQYQQWPTIGHIGYITLAILEGFHTLRNGNKMRSGPQVGRLGTSPLRVGGPQRFKAGGKISSGPQVGRLTTSHLLSGVPNASQRGDKLSSGPQVGRLATSLLPSRVVSKCFKAGDKIISGPQVARLAKFPLPYWVPALQSGGQKSVISHQWADWLHHPCHLGGSPTLQTRGQGSSARLATSPCHLGGSAALERQGPNWQSLASGQIFFQKQ